MGFESITEIKRESRERSEEVYYRNPENPARALTMSPFEQIRYEENSKLARVVCRKLYDLLDGKVQLADIKDASIGISSLSAPQRKVIDAIVSNISKTIEWKPNSRRPSLHSLYELHGKNQVGEFFYRGVEHRGVSSHEISDEQISLTLLDVVLIHVNDPATWAKLVGNAGHAEDCEGFLKKYHLSGEVPHSMNDYAYINRQFERTVYINVGGKKADEIRKIERHELFHDLYHQAIEPMQTSTYKSGPMHDWFVEMKDEIVAYVLSERWATSLSKFTRSSNRAIFTDKLFTKKIKEGLVRVALEKRGVDPLDFMLAAEKDKDTLSKRLSPDELADISKQADLYYLEILFVQRELGRLKLLKSKSFDAALRATLTAQSFKEMVYHLSRMDAGIYADALLLVAGPEEKWDVKAIATFVSSALNMKLPVLHLPEMIERVRNSHTIGYFQNTLAYYEKNQDRWLNPTGDNHLGFNLIT